MSGCLCVSDFNPCEAVTENGDECDLRVYLWLPTSSVPFNAFADSQIVLFLFHIKVPESQKMWVKTKYFLELHVLSAQFSPRAAGRRRRPSA